MNDDAGGKSALSEGLGLVPDRVAFADVCAMLPEGMSWGDPMTPPIAREIVDAAVAAERERCAAAVRAVPKHRWVDGSDQWGNPCLAKIVATRDDYVAASLGA